MRRDTHRNHYTFRERPKPTNRPGPYIGAAFTDPDWGFSATLGWSVPRSGECLHALGFDTNSPSSGPRNWTAKSTAWLPCAVGAAPSLKDKIMFRLASARRGRRF